MPLPCVTASVPEGGGRLAGPGVPEAGLVGLEAEATACPKLVHMNHRAAVVASGDSKHLLI